MAVAEKSERLEARVSAKTKALLQEAASLQGRSITDFVVQSAVEAANKVVEQHEVIELSREARIAFIEALLNPPEPNERLKEAARRYHEFFGTGE